MHVTIVITAALRRVGGLGIFKNSLVFEWRNLILMVNSQEKKKKKKKKKKTKFDLSVD